MCILLLGCTILPLLACTLEDDIHVQLPLPFKAGLKTSLPFIPFWLTALCFVCNWARRRHCSASCVGSFILLWLPSVSLSVLLFLRFSFLPKLPSYAIFAPSLSVTSILLIFVGFLVVASFWLGYRGNRDWTEYATITLLTMLTLLLPFLIFQFALLGYMSGKVSVNGVFFSMDFMAFGFSTLCSVAYFHTSD